MRILKSLTFRRGATRLQCFGMVLAGICLASPFKVGVVKGTSMQPTLDHGQVYLIDRTHYLHRPVERGDVLVFRKDKVAYVKRVVAVPGDMIYLLRLAGEPGDDLVVSEFQLSRLKRAVNRPPWSKSHKLIQRRIPEGYYFVLGDHRNVSIDSRQFGLVKQDEILGHVLFMPEKQIPGDTIAGRFIPQPRS